jgi:hypothetical protein
MGIVSMTSQINSLSGQFEIERLLELLNSDPQGIDQHSPDIYPRSNQSLVEAEILTDESRNLDTSGSENRFVAHISQAMSKTKSNLFGIPER